MRQAAVVWIDADAVAGAGDVRVDDLEQRRCQFRGEIEVAGALDMTADRLQEPERAVDRVVLERPGVGRVREHALAHRRGVAEPQSAPLVGSVGLEE